MFISVIIPTLGRARLLDRTLLSLTQQSTDREFEIIVIDNGSKDNTLEICKSYQERFDNFVYVYDDRPGLLVGRHVGALRAAGDVLTFIDDDVIIPPYWLQGIADVFGKDSKVSLATGNNYPFFESPPPRWLDQMWCRNGSGGKYLYQLSFLCLGHQGMAIDPGLVWGLNFHIRRDFFFDLGGFHPDILSTEYMYFIGDGELGITKKMREMKINARFDPRLSLYHTATRERLTREYFIRRSYTEGLMDGYTDIRACVKSGAAPPLTKKNERTKLLKCCLKHIFTYFTNNELFKLKKDIGISSVRGYNDYISRITEDDVLQRYVKEDNYLDIDGIASKYYLKTNQ